jgi:hypothetical protein
MIDNPLPVPENANTPKTWKNTRKPKTRFPARMEKI